MQSNLPSARKTFILFVGCSAASIGAAQVPQRADVTLTQVTVRHYRGSELRVVARAPTVELIRTTNDFRAFDAGVFLKRTGVEVMAKQIEGNALSEVATGFGGVGLAGQDGLRAQTERATFDRHVGAEGGVSADAGVVVEHPRFDLTARAFSFDLAQQRAWFEQPVTKTRP